MPRRSKSPTTAAPEVPPAAQRTDDIELAPSVQIPEWQPQLQELTARFDRKFEALFAVLQQSASRPSALPIADPTLPTLPSVSTASRHFEADDLNPELGKLALECINDPAARYNAARQTMAAVKAKPFKLRTDSLKFRAFLRTFVRIVNSCNVDARDIAKILVAALDEDSIAHLQLCGVDLADFKAMVQALATRSRPTLADYVRLLTLFSAEVPGHRTPEEYYFALFEYHINTPAAVTPLQVLTHFLQTVSEALRGLLMSNIVHLQDVPDQQFILSIVRSYTPPVVSATIRQSPLAAAASPSPLPALSPSLPAAARAPWAATRIEVAPSVMQPVTLRAGVQLSASTVKALPTAPWNALRNAPSAANQVPMCTSFARILRNSNRICLKQHPHPQLLLRGPLDLHWSWRCKVTPTRLPASSEPMKVVDRSVLEKCPSVANQRSLVLTQVVQSAQSPKVFWIDS